MLKLNAKYTYFTAAMVLIVGNSGGAERKCKKSIINSQNLS